MGLNNNDGHKPKLQIAIQPNIGLDSSTRQSILVILNHTLADEVVLTAKTRSAHWNGCGSNYYELHTLLGTQYQQLSDSSDEIAERGRMLGGRAIASLQEFLDHTRLEEQPGGMPDILRLLADHEAVIRFIREDARKCTEEYEDEGTSELLVGVMRMHEKMAWILRSNLKTEPALGEGQVLS